MIPNEKKEKWTYLLGMLGQNILFFTVSSGFGYYLQNVLFIPAIIVSIILILGQVLDASNDLIFGLLIDRTSTKFGKCRPYILFGTPVAVIFTILIFTNSIYSSDNSATTNAFIILWAAVAYIIWGFVYSACDVPMFTLPSLLTDNEKERTTIQSLGKTFGSMGSGVMLIMLPLAQFVGTRLSVRLGDNDKGLQYGVVLIVAILTLVGGSFLQLTGFVSKEHVKTKSPAASQSIRNSLQQIWRCKPYRQIIISQMIKSPVNTVDRISPVFMSYYYGNNGAYNYVHFLLLFGLSGTAGQFVANAVLPMLSEKISKVLLYKLSCILSSVAYALYFVLYLISPSGLHHPGLVVAIMLLLFANGFGYGMQNVLCYVFTAAAVDYEEYHSGHRPDGVFFSGQLMMNKASSGVGAAIIGVVTALFGFSGANVQSVNNALFHGADFKSDIMFSKYRMMLMLLNTMPYALGMLLSIAPMRKYARITEEFQALKAVEKTAKNLLEDQE